MAAANGVAVTVGGEATAAALNRILEPNSLLIVDIEGAEIELLDPASTPALRHADILVELHDFLRPGAEATILARFRDRTPHFIEQQPRDPSAYPALASLDPADQLWALDEFRPRGQRWLWLPVARPE
jgi:hypothetical protein